MSSFNQDIAEECQGMVKMLSECSDTVLDSCEKINNSNWQWYKSVIKKGEQITQQAFSDKDPQEFLNSQGDLLQPIAEKAIELFNQHHEIYTHMQSTLNHLFEQQMAECSKKFQKMTEHLTKNAPPGSEAAIAAVKSVLTTASSTVDTAMRMTQQAAETANKNFATARAAGKAAKK